MGSIINPIRHISVIRPIIYIAIGRHGKGIINIICFGFNACFFRVSIGGTHGIDKEPY